MPNCARIRAPPPPPSRHDLWYERNQQAREPFAVGFDVFRSESVETVGKFIGGLQRLTLHLDAKGDTRSSVERKSELRCYLAQTLVQAVSLIHLSMHTQDHNNLSWAPHKPDDPNETCGTGFLRSFLTEVQLPRIQSIDLGGFNIQASHLKDFLARHASSLRCIRLYNCFVDCGARELAYWAGKTLQLKGVDLTLSYAFEPPERTSSGYTTRYFRYMD